MDLYLSASYFLQIEDYQVIKNLSRTEFEYRFRQGGSTDLSFIEFESNVKQVKVEAIGASVVSEVGSVNAWQTLMSEFNKSKAVIMRDREPISSLLDHDDFESTINRTMKKIIKGYLDDTCREYVKRNSFKVIYDSKFRVRLKKTQNLFYIFSLNFTKRAA